MSRKKYRYATRREYHQAYTDLEQSKLRSEWLLTAILANRYNQIGKTGRYTIGYVVVRHTCFVYALSDPLDGVHCVSGTWSIDDQDLDYIIRSLNRTGLDGDTDNLALSHLLERAKRAAVRATQPVDV